MKAFDLASIDLQKEASLGAWMQLADPRTRQPIFADGEVKTPEGDEAHTPVLDVSLNLLGAESDTVKMKLDELEKRRASRESKRYEDLLEEGEGKKAAYDESRSTKDELLDDDAELLATATIGWRNFAFNGVEKFSYELAVEFYRSREWAIRQAQFYVANHANFMKGQESN
ncbi:MAG: hypothetical protein COA78_06950 [Blastopirellula sp.]|nr:MAG: hypothetical protein COA78_06950 [Blastopirellula sp.]